MFIREFKTKKKDVIYYNHKLVESYRNAENKPRQRIIMSLGNLKDLPKACWKELAFLLEQKISGQETFVPNDPALLSLADSLYASADFHQKKVSSQALAAEQQDFANQMEKAGIPAEFHTIISTKGHDSFLLEPELYAKPIRRILG